MRTALKALGTDLRRFRATVSRLGHCADGRIETICLEQVTTVQGKLVADHLWCLRRLFCHWLEPGHVIEFDARPCRYIRHGQRALRDWTLVDVAVIVAIGKVA